MTPSKCEWTSLVILLNHNLLTKITVRTVVNLAPGLLLIDALKGLTRKTDTVQGLAIGEPVQSGYS